MDLYTIILYLAVKVKTGAGVGSEHNPADHPRPVLQYPGDGGGKRRGGTVTHTQPAQHCRRGQAAGHRAGECLDCVPDLVTIVSNDVNNEDMVLTWYSR